MLNQPYLRVQGAIWALCVGLIWLPLPPFASSAFGAESRLYKSAALLGQGDTGIASVRSADAIFYNPAGLARGKGLYQQTIFAAPQIEFSAASRDLSRELLIEDQEPLETLRRQIGRPQHLGLQNFTGIVLNRAALGALVSGELDVLAHKSERYGGLEVIEAGAAQNAALSFSLAENFWQEALAIGLTTKYLWRGAGQAELAVAAAEEAQAMLNQPNELVQFGSGFGIDLGLQYVLTSNFSTGLVISQSR